MFTSLHVSKIVPMVDLRREEVKVLKVRKELHGPGYL